VKTIDLGKEQPSLADVLTLAKSEPVVIHSGPGEDYLIEPADELDREAAAQGSSERFFCPSCKRDQMRPAIFRSMKSAKSAAYDVCRQDTGVSNSEYQ